jgi:hypothetical protein
MHTYFNVDTQENYKNAILLFVVEGDAEPAAEPAAATAKALPTTASVLVDGETIAFEAYNIEGSNYCFRTTRPASRRPRRARPSTLTVNRSN